ncbi:MAG: undecaprenyl-diphosphate phosphatase [Desulfarculus sp.]|nr:undecaprenyl-diphosphate phosphatase [Desulfarculus sp.]
MSIWQILILAVVQGAAELLPVSSSAHVIVASKLMGLDPTSPEMVMLLVMLHTGTMFAVIAYFWRAWRLNYFGSRHDLWEFCKQIIIATACTGVLGLGLKFLIEKVFLGHRADAAVEHLFGELGLVALALASVGCLIILAGIKAGRRSGRLGLFPGDAVIIGLVQGLCLPFRGFSRSGATISTALLLGINKARAEEFSFALVVVLTPPVIVRSVWRLLKAQSTAQLSGAALWDMFYPSLLGMVFSFLAGLVALRWLSRWLEGGRWQWFGMYCLLAAAAVYTLHRAGF